VNETVVSLESEHSRDLITINDGALLVTAKNQPMWVASDGEARWVRDPIDLEVGDLLYDPVQNEWVKITELGRVTTNTKVYDLIADRPNTFIANGFLLDQKEQ
jgi:hypothetical protein